MATDYFRISSNDSVHLLELSLPEMIDSVEFDTLSARMLGALEGKAGQRWIVDLAGVSYMGSAMLGLMVNIRQQIKSASGRLILCSMSPRLSEIFHACCLERLFTIVKTRPQAIEQFAAR